MDRVEEIINEIQNADCLNHDFTIVFIRPFLCDSDNLVIETNIDSVRELFGEYMFESGVFLCITSSKHVPYTMGCTSKYISENYDKIDTYIIVESNGDEQVNDDNCLGCDDIFQIVLSNVVLLSLLYFTFK